MIVVTVELHSSLNGTRETLAKAIIANEGGTNKHGDYTCYVGNKNDVDDLGKIYRKPQRTGKVTKYPRLAYNVWRLVIRGLRDAFPEEK